VSGISPADLMALTVHLKEIAQAERSGEAGERNG